MNERDLSQTDLYLGREQTQIKHLILQKYLQRFAHIIGSRWDVITYVDCFSGPWNVQSEEMKDSSFAIALQELQTARAQHGIRGKSVKLRCLFLEKNPKAYAKLKAFAENAKNAVVETRNAELSTVISEVGDFVKRGGSKSFPFIFVDPTGWTGFALDEIAPLLRLDPGEVLINFMTGHIIRFLDSPDQMTQDSFVRLFGSATFKQRLQGLARKDREDAAVKEYAENVAKAGNYRFYSKAIVLHPLFDRTHFYLIYLTRNAKGIEVFKETEKKALSEMQHTRAQAHQRAQQAKTSQTELFEPEVLHSGSYLDDLRKRYCDKAKEQVFQILRDSRKVLYDDVWSMALRESLVWESDLKEWVAEWEKQKLLLIDGKKARQKVPHRNEGNYLVWI